MAHDVQPEIIYPLAYSDTGDPAEVPEDAKFFRMKVFRSGAKRPEIVRTEAGIPRLIPLTTTPDEFRRMVGPGRYRLEPVYSTGASIDNAEAAIVVIEESTEGPSKSSSEQFVDRMLDDQRQLVERMFEHAEKQAAESARLLASYAAQNEKIVVGLAEQSQRLLSTMANQFGGYLTGSAKLLRASHPAVDSKPRTPIEVIEEAEAVRNAVDGLANGEGGDDRMLTLVEKTIEGGMPLVRQLIHRWVLGLSDAQAKALTGEAPAAVGEPESQDVKASTVDFITHLNAIQKHLSADEITAARVRIASMAPAEIEAWKAQLLACKPKDAAAVLRAELAKESSK